MVVKEEEREQKILRSRDSNEYFAVAAAACAGRQHRRGTIRLRLSQGLAWFCPVGDVGDVGASGDASQRGNTTVDCKWCSAGAKFWGVKKKDAEARGEEGGGRRKGGGA